MASELSVERRVVTYDRRGRGDGGDTLPYGGDGADPDHQRDAVADAELCAVLPDVRPTVERAGAA